MRIRLGTLDTPLGHKAASGEWTFVACVGAPERGDMSRFRLSDHLDANAAPPVLRRAMQDGWDVAWVRARLPRVFGYEPMVSEMEKTLLWECFVAVRGDDAYLFACDDHYGKTALYFSGAGSDEETKSEIARAFWSLLLREPDDLADFSARVYHPGAGVWMTFACKDGEPSFEESDDD